MHVKCRVGYAIESDDGWPVYDDHADVDVCPVETNETFDDALQRLKRQPAAQHHVSVDRQFVYYYTSLIKTESRDVCITSTSGYKEL